MKHEFSYLALEQPQTDAVIGIVESNGRLLLFDMWATSKYSPLRDNSQDIADKEGYIENGITTIKFSRYAVHLDWHLPTLVGKCLFYDCLKGLL